MTVMTAEPVLQGIAYLPCHVIQIQIVLNYRFHYRFHLRVYLINVNHRFLFVREIQTVAEDKVVHLGYAFHFLQVIAYVTLIVEMDSCANREAVVSLNRQI